MLTNWLYFNPLVNKLNRKLKIRHKQYLSFLLTYLILFVFAIYQFGKYESIQVREQKIHKYHQYLSIINRIQLEIKKEQLWLSDHSRLLYNYSSEIDFQQRDSYYKNLIDSIHSISNKLPELNINNLSQISSYLEDELRYKYSNKVKQIFGTLKQLEYYMLFPEGDKSGLDSIRNEFKKQTSHDIDFLEAIHLQLQQYEIAGNKHYETILWQQDQLYRTEIRRILLVLVFSLLFWYIISNYVVVRITKPIEFLKSNINILGRGDYEFKNEFLTVDKDEINEITVGVKKIARLIRNTILFARQIGKNNFDDIEEYLAEGELTKSMKEMRDNLKLVSDENLKQKQIEGRRKWNMEGIAQIADLLRKSYKNLDKLYYDIVRFLVRYIDANQGAIYILNSNAEGKEYLEMKAAFAYGRNKSVHKQIEKGEGLVGQCFVEKESVLISEIPDEYIEIKSGLGGSSPSFLFLVPIKLDDEVHGVFEVASFKEFSEYQREFLVQSMENIGASISNTKLSMQTAELLKTTQEQTEQLQSSEEEMRQNIEELQATQEETRRREDELLHSLDAIKRKEAKIQELLDTSIEREILFQEKLSEVMDENEALKEEINKLRSNPD
jgi:hypothetical protein